MNEPPPNSLAHKLTRFFDDGKDTPLVFDDDPIDPVGNGTPESDATPADALERWRRGLDRSPGCARALAAILARGPSRVHDLGDDPESEEFIVRALAGEQTAGRGRGAKAAGLHCCLAAWREARGRLDEAITGHGLALDILLEVPDGDPPDAGCAAVPLVKLLESTGKPDEARRVKRKLALRELIERRDHTGFVQLRMIALELFIERDYDGAEAIYRRLLENRFEVPGTHCHLARLHLMRGRREAAGREVERARETQMAGPPYVKGRAGFLRALLGLLSGREDVMADLLGLEKLLRDPAVHLDWTIQPVIDHWRHQLTEDQHTLLTALARALGNRENLSALEQLPGWLRVKEGAAAEHAAEMSRQRDALLENPAETLVHALACNNLALDLRAAGRPADAEALLRRAIVIEAKLLPPGHPKRPHRLNNLASILLALGKRDEARELLDRALQEISSKTDLTAARVLCYRLALAWLENEPGDRFIAQLKALLAGPPLVPTDGIAAGWDPRAVFASLGPGLSDEQHALLPALAETLNTPAEAEKLNLFPLWRDQPAVPPAEKQLSLPINPPSPPTSVGASSRVKLAAVGGAGGEVLKRIGALPFGGVDLWMIDTDYASLEGRSPAGGLLIGWDACRGNGAGGDPASVRPFTGADREAIVTALDSASVILIAAGLGGGTGSGAAPAVAEIAAGTGALVIALVTLPFEFEGKRRTLQAQEALQSLRSSARFTIALPHGSLPSTPESTVLELLHFGAGLTGRAARVILGLLVDRENPFAEPLVADELQQFPRGLTLFGLGAGEGENPAATAIEALRADPLFHPSGNLRNARRLLISISHGPGIEDREIEAATAATREIFGHDPRAIRVVKPEPKWPRRIEICVLGAEE